MSGYIHLHNLEALARASFPLLSPLQEAALSARKRTGRDVGTSVRAGLYRVCEMVGEETVALSDWGSMGAAVQFGKRWFN